jgi:predicted DsbA family dithiol-disulfide isomerase
MRAYFTDNRTISERAVILDVAAQVDLDRGVLTERLENDTEALAREVVADHKTALAQGIAAVPTAIINDEYMLQGAMALDQYRKVVARLAS